MTSTQITALLVTYRRPEFLRRAISSVLGQTYSNLKLIVFDDASGDKTKDVAQSFSKNDKRIKEMVKKLPEIIMMYLSQSNPNHNNQIPPNVKTIEIKGSISKIFLSIIISISISFIASSILQKKVDENWEMNLHYEHISRSLNVSYEIAMDIMGDSSENNFVKFVDTLDVKISTPGNQNPCSKARSLNKVPNILLTYDKLIVRVVITNSNKDLILECETSSEISFPNRLGFTSHLFLTGFSDYNFDRDGKSKWIAESQLNYLINNDLDIVLEFRYNGFEQDIPRLKGFGVAPGIKLKF